MPLLRVPRERIKDTNEYEIYARKTLGFKGDRANFYPAESEGQDLFVCGNPEGGIYTQFLACRYLKHPNNPLYDRADAKEFAHEIVLDVEIPYNVSTLMIDEGLLSDAKMASERGVRHGRALMQNNIYFINDYFRERCRDLDYNIIR